MTARALDSRGLLLHGKLGQTAIITQNAGHPSFEIYVRRCDTVIHFNAFFKRLEIPLD